MRGALILLAMAVTLALSGCQSLPFGKTDATEPLESALATPEVTVEVLAPTGDAPAEVKEAEPKPLTELEEEPQPSEVEAPAPVPEPPKSASQIACEKRGGRLVKFGESGLKTCQMRTKDGGKQCRRATDCEGVCLARTGSCAPATPLPGCNDVLLANGSRFKLCVS